MKLPLPLIPAILLLFFVLTLSQAQITVGLTVNNGQATTTCTDIFGIPGNAFWGVNVEGEGWETYPDLLTCPDFVEPPFLQYQQTFNCPADLPDSIEVCFRAFDKDGLFCDLNPDCLEIICQNFPLPDPFTTADYSLMLPAGGASEGFVDFTIGAAGAVATNDLPCDAIDLGVLTAGGFIGDTSQSLYSNFCATNVGEPNPFLISGAFWNASGVWFTFEVGPGVGDLVVVHGVSDPSGLGAELDLEMALYRTPAGACDGPLNQYRLSPPGPVLDTRILAECLQEGERCYILVDGANAIPQGLFGIGVEDPGVQAGPEDICDAAFLGAVPPGDSLLLTNQTNDCADNTGDPPVPQFGVESSVWYTFVPPPSGNTIVEVVADPLNIEPIDVQMAIFSSASGTCNGPFTLEEASYTPADPGELIEFPCLDPNQTYWLLVDGEGSQEDDGVFDIVISDGGVPPPVVTIDTAICFGDFVEFGSSIFTSTGNYTELVPLPNGCDSTINLNLTVWDELILQAQQLSPVTSALVDNGSAELSTQGGVPPYSLSWSNGDTTALIDSLAAGQYCVTVIDSEGCSAVTCVEIIEDIPELVATAEADSVSCFGGADGSVTLIVTGADSPYDYSWPGGAGSINLDSGSALISGLPAGNYAITVTNQAGEMDTAFVQVFEPPILELNLVEAINPLCFGDCNGSLEVVPMGGTPPYSFTWAGGFSDLLYPGLCSGNYSLTLTDANGCSTTNSYTLSDPVELVAEVAVISGVTCFGDTDGQASVSLNGNAVSWQWDNGEMTAQAGSLSGGPHTVTVTDELGCTAVGNAQIPAPAQPFTAQIDLFSPITCAGDADGVLAAQTSGGYAGMLAYQWSNGGFEPSISGLSEGAYSLSVTDPGGCSRTATFSLEAPPEIEVVLSAQDATCAGQELDGIVFVESSSGGVPPYRYGLDTSLFVTQTQFGNLPPDDYEVYVQDANGCIRAFETTVFPPPEVGLQLSPDQTIRLGETADLFASAGSPDVIFLWSPPDSLSCTDCTDPIAAPVADTRYTVLAVDTFTSCQEEAFTWVYVDPDRTVYVPNIFSPNEDGYNDHFSIFSDLNIRVRQMQIFDRWGNQIFTTNNVPVNNSLFGWNGDGPDGRPAPPGVYVYLFEVVFADGVTEMVSGSVTLIR